MKHLLGLLMALLMIFAATAVTYAAEEDGPEGIVSETYLVMDAASGQILAQRGAHQKMFPASITKILTSALALERGNPADLHTMSYEAVHSVGRDTTHIALTDGEMVPVEALLNATMIQSANDAANGLAEYISGDMATFAALMNETAKRIGANESNFVTPSGLHEDDHYTTAYDMAMITRWALSIDGFRELFGAEEYSMAPTNVQSQPRNFGTKNHMLVESAFYYEGTEGGKLGWTPEANHTLVVTAKRGDLELICVVMKSRAQYDKYKDAAKLLDYCFDNYSAVVFDAGQLTFRPIPVFDGAEQVAELRLTPGLLQIARPATVAKVDIRAEVVAPERYQEGEAIAPTVRFTGPGGELLCELPLTYELTSPDGATPYVPGRREKRELGAGSWLMIPLGFLCVAFGILMSIRARNLRERERERQRRMARRARRTTMPLSERPSGRPEVNSAAQRDGRPTVSATARRGRRGE